MGNDREQWTTTINRLSEVQRRILMAFAESVWVDPDRDWLPNGVEIDTRFAGTTNNALNWRTDVRVEGLMARERDGREADRQRHEASAAHLARGPQLVRGRS